MIELPNGFAQAGALIQAGFLVWYKAHQPEESIIDYFKLAPYDQEVYYYRYKKEMRVAMDQLRERMSTVTTEDSCLDPSFLSKLPVRTKNALQLANSRNGTEDYTDPYWLAQQGDNVLHAIPGLGTKGISDIRIKLIKDGFQPL